MQAAKRRQPLVVANKPAQKLATGKRLLEVIKDLSKPLEMANPLYNENETLDWCSSQKPVWSRLKRRNSVGAYRYSLLSKQLHYDVEIPGRLWSLWGSIHPTSPLFDESSRGRQFLACNVIACSAAYLFLLTNWSSQALDTIVTTGDQYHRESFPNVKNKNIEYTLENLNTECVLEDVHLAVQIKKVLEGNLYCKPTKKRANLGQALLQFLDEHTFGILQCKNRTLAIGHSNDHDGAYFIFDCQSKDTPIFPSGEGAAYLLRTKHFQVLLYCVVTAMNVPYFNTPFTLHSVNFERLRVPKQRENLEPKKFKGSKVNI